jgi:nucleotide-binding universal stress UspA family protein
VGFDRILVPLDGSTLGEQALAHAVRIAKAFESQLLLLRVLDAPPASAQRIPETIDWRLRSLQTHRYLDALTERLAESGLDTETLVSEGRAAEGILECIHERKIDLVVLSAYGWGGESHFPLGGTAQKVIAAASTSIAVIRPDRFAQATEPRTGYRKVLVPLDGSPRAEWALALAASLVTPEHGELLVIQVVPAPEMPRRQPLTQEESDLRNKLIECNRRAAEQYLTDVVARFRSRVEIRSRIVVSSNVTETIRTVAESENVELIALAARGIATGATRQGSTSHALLVECGRPTLVLQESQRSAFRFRDEVSVHTKAGRAFASH